MMRSAVAFPTRVLPLAPPLSALLTTDTDTPASRATSTSRTPVRVRLRPEANSEAAGIGFFAGSRLGSILRAKHTRWRGVLLKSGTGRVGRRASSALEH